MNMIDQDLQRKLNEAILGLTHFTSGLAFISLDSTNDYALKLEKSGAPSGTVVIAAEQTNGRGRLNRSWLMQKGDIALSIILRPPHLPGNLATLPMMPALAAVLGLAELNIDVKLKWPNDIVIQSQEKERLLYFSYFRKVGGILVENVFRNDALAASIIGMGLNLQFNESLKLAVPHAGFLAEVNNNVSQGGCLKSFFGAMDKIISSISNHPSEQILAQYQEHCATLGMRVEAMVSGIKVCGYATKVREDGALVLNDGLNEHIVFAGDVTFIV